MTNNAEQSVNLDVFTDPSKLSNEELKTLEDLAGMKSFSKKVVEDLSKPENMQKIEAEISEYKKLGKSGSKYVEGLLKRIKDKLEKSKQCTSSVSGRDGVVLKEEDKGGKKGGDECKTSVSGKDGVVVKPESKIASKDAWDDTSKPAERKGGKLPKDKVAPKDLWNDTGKPVEEKPVEKVTDIQKNTVMEGMKDLKISFSDIFGGKGDKINIKTEDLKLLMRLNGKVPSGESSQKGITLPNKEIKISSAQANGDTVLFRFSPINPNEATQFSYTFNLGVKDCLMNNKFDKQKFAKSLFDKYKDKK